MAIQIKQVIVKPGLWGLTKKDLRDAGRVAIRACGDYWHQKFKKHHFQTYAYARYGYKPRTEAYRRRKHHEHPEAEGRPLVWTGDSERRAMASQAVVATAKSWESFKAEVTIDAPTLNYQQLYEEVTVVNAQEQGILQNLFATEFTREFLAIASTHMAPQPLAAA